MRIINPNVILAACCVVKAGSGLTAKELAAASISPSVQRPLVCLGASSNPKILFSGFLSLPSSALDFPIFDDSLPTTGVFNPLPAAVKVVVAASFWFRFLGIAPKPEEVMPIRI